MIELMKHTYMLEPKKVKNDLNRLWEKYQKIIHDKDADWEQLNEARAILFLTGNMYCEEIAVKAIERRLHLLKEKISLIEFFDLIDKESSKLKKLREDALFSRLEKFYRVIKEYKNRYHEGKFYLDEEKFIKEYNKKIPDEDFHIGYKGGFGKRQ